MNYGESGLIKEMKGNAVQELQMRLAGFSGGVPDGDFGKGTVKQVKQFQQDFMKMSEPDGIVNQETYAAIDRFAKQYPLPFDKLKCPCGICSGFGQGLFRGEYRDGKPKVEAYHLYEYPGIHRMLLWASRAVMHYNPGYSFSINSGYRCSENNKQRGRTSTNHHGKAIDLDVPNSTGETKEDDRQRCNAIRASIVRHSNAQIGWASPNKKSLEPERIAPTWVHYDVRQFASIFLDDRFFCKTSDQLDKPLSNTLTDQAGDTASSSAVDQTSIETIVEGTVLASSLNVRARPQADGALLGKVSKNDIVKVSQNKNGWCQIDFEGKTAFVSARYIKLKS